MHRHALWLLPASAAFASADRPANMTICDYSAVQLFNDSSAASQYHVVVALVNTAVIGSYKLPSTVHVDGILAPGTFNGTSVNLLPYFNGSLQSTNYKGKASSFNFLDDGGYVPLKGDKPATGTKSAQYALLTHLYQYFGALLGCSAYNTTGFPAYAGTTSMYEVHKYMVLDASEVGYFIQQVGLAAQSFGVSDNDVRLVGATLQTIFGQKCQKPAVIIPEAESELQSICTADDCPLAYESNCSAYGPVVSPAAAAVPTNSSSPNATATATKSGASSQRITRCLEAALGAVAVAVAMALP